MNAARPLDRFPIIRTRSVDEVRGALARIYAKPAFEPTAGVKTLDASVNHHHLQHIELHYNKYGAAVRVGFPETDFFLQIFSLCGKGEAVIGKTTVSVGPGSSVVVSSHVGYQAFWAADFERLVLKIEAEALTHKLAAMTGQSIGAPLVMNPAPDFARPEAHILRDHFMFLVRELSAAVLPSPMVLAEFEQALMVMFLRANRHNYSHLLEQQPPDIAPWQVRGAEEYIETNWSQPIALEDLAAVTGVSARSLFRTFKRNRGYSPMDFVNQTRRRYKSKH